MERRLIAAYDRMTMPDHCVQKLEQQLQQTEENRAKGYYTQIQFSQPVRKTSRLRSAAAVCLMFVLLLGSAVLLLGGLPTLRPSEQVMADSTQSEPVPEDIYAAVVKFNTRDQVENFAKIVRHNVLQENWEALRNKVSFPVTIQDQTITEWTAFQEWMEIFAMNPLLTDRLEQESCQAMFCNWQGISMARGLIWLGEINGELKITAVNVEVQDEPLQPKIGKKVPAIFAEILSGERIKMVGIVNSLTIEEYYADWREDVLLDTFAVIDMDEDGICELVISTQTVDGDNGGYLVLREDDGEICTYPFQASELLDLKKDGSFFWRDGEYRAYFDGKTHWHTEEIQTQNDRPLAQWHSWPCRSPELLLRSYEHVTGTGWSVFPGNAHYLFEGLAMERTGNAMKVMEYWKNTGVWCQEGDRVYVVDPDAPGTAFYGTLTEENGFTQFSSVGYYISGEDREYQGEIRNLLSDAPEYWVDVHLPSFMGTFGRMVSTPEELMAYFGYTPMPDEAVMKQTRELKSLVRELTLAYMEAGSQAMKPHLAETYQYRSEKYFPENAEVVLLTYSTMPDRALEVGETLHTYTGVCLAGDGKFYSFNLELVKEKDGWKVEGYYLNIPEE